MKFVSFISSNEILKSIDDICGTLVLEFEDQKNEILEDVELCGLYNFLVCNCYDASFTNAEFKLYDYQMPTVFSLIKRDERTVEFIRDAFDASLGMNTFNSYVVTFSDLLSLALKLKEILIEQLGTIYNKREIEIVIENNLEKI